MSTYRSEIEKINEYELHDKKEEYYERTKNFLLSNSKILVNPGGMGLGKTFATSAAIKHTMIRKEFAMVTCPTAPLKGEWATEMERLGLNRLYMMWFSKPSCCIKKMIDDKIDVQKNCNDDCEYWGSQENNGEQDIKLFENLSILDNLMPIFPQKYYKINGCSHCLLPVTRYGLKKRDYLIGDYYAFLNSTAFRKIMNTREEQNKNTSNGILIIDEAHMVPDRAKKHLSKKINFTSMIKKLKKEICCDYVNKQGPIFKNKWETTLEVLDEIEEEINKSTTRTKWGAEGRLDYNTFKQIYDTNHKSNCFLFDNFLDELRLLAVGGYGYDFGDYESKDDPNCAKLFRFFTRWEEVSLDPIYKTKFQYKEIDKQNRLILIIDCCDTSGFLRTQFRQWKKVVLNSGTIPDMEYFKFQTGIDVPEFKTTYEPVIESYSIREHVIRFGSGVFTGAIRRRTYMDESEKLNSILNIIEGRTIIYVQSKKDSILLRGLLETDLEIMDFCSNDDETSTSQEEFLELVTAFNNKKEAIAIMNIGGRVEGFNFKSKIDGSSVKNIIVFGYPYAKRGQAYTDAVAYYTEKTGSRIKAVNWMDYSPVLGKIHQAICRGKRCETDSPNLILWGEPFTSTRAISHMPDDMKGESFGPGDIDKFKKRIIDGKK